MTIERRTLCFVVLKRSLRTHEYCKRPK